MAFFRRCSLRFMLILCTLLFLRAHCQEGKTDVDDIIVEFVNTTYINEDTLEISVNYKDDGNTVTINIDVIKELPSPIILSIKLWGRTLGQYKVPTGISLDVDICDGKLKKYFLENLLRNIGVDITECPPKPGSYGVEDYNAQIDGLPSYSLPGLNILLEVELHSPPQNISVLKLKTYNRVR